MKYIAIALICLGFFALIGAAVYYTESSLCLLALVALVLIPEITLGDKEQKQ